MSTAEVTLERLVDAGVRSAYPLVVVQDRYGGTYSGGQWLAIASGDELQDGEYRSAWVLDNGPHAGDVEAREFWSRPPSWIASGPTPEAAIRALLTNAGA